MSSFVQKYFFIIAFLLVNVFNKGLEFLLGKINLSMPWNSVFSINFLIGLSISLIEFIIIGYVLLGCIDRDSRYNQFAI